MFIGALGPEASAAIQDDLLELGSWQVGPALPEGSEHDFDVIARFASGQFADNKLVIDLPTLTYEAYCEEIPSGRRLSRQSFEAVRENVLRVYNLLTGLHRRQPDTMWGVPNGGQAYGRERARRLGLEFVELAKVAVTPGKKTFRPATAADARRLAEAEVMVGSEDAGSEGTSPYGALYESDDHGLEELRKKTVGIDYVWVRGELSRLRGLGLAINTIIYQPVPERISRQHPFYRKFGRLAVPRPALDLDSPGP